jgi:putative DNA primase/helicase
MQFLDFCKAHGILIHAIPPIGVWRRYATEDHPAKRNGAVKFMGDHAFIQNHATMTEIEVWKGDAEAKVDHARIRRLAQEAENEIKRKQQEAAKKAAWILHQCQIAYHPYLEKKGFKEEQGNVWKTDDGLFLVIPMRVGNSLVGCQIINEEGGKKFLLGQKTSGAAFVFDNHGPHILCEGYATAMSIRAAMKALKRRYTLHVCFSAGNMKKVAATLPGGFVVADHDASRTGENTAKEIGWPYFMPPDEGQDFNDFSVAVGLFKSSQALGKVIR